MSNKSLLGSDLLPLGLLLLEALELLLFLGALLPPFVDVLLQLLVQLALLRLLARLQEVPISPDDVWGKTSTGIVILGYQTAIHLVWFIGTAWEL